MIHATNKSLAELGDQVEAAEKQDIEAAIAALQEAMKGDDKDAIESSLQALGEKSGKLAERVYQQKAAQDAGAEQAQSSDSGNAEAGAGKEDVVDAEFEEVKENDK